MFKNLKIYVVVACNTRISTIEWIEINFWFLIFLYYIKTISQPSIYFYKREFFFVPVFFYVSFKAHIFASF